MVLSNVKAATKYIFVSGGVISGLGKGIVAASVGLLLKSRGVKVTAMKCDMYLNIDAGTMNPLEHGEVFVTADGMETDQDLGHYERFLDIELTRANYVTNGQVYQEVLSRERALAFGGRTVQPYHHIPPIIIDRINAAAKANKADVIIVELGGTVGEYEGLLFFETIRRLKQQKPADVVLIHVGYLPRPSAIGELKSKPLQQSISQLNSLGLSPDLIIARAENEVDQKRKEKIALASGLKDEEIIANPDAANVYEVPLILEKQNLDQLIADKLGVKLQEKDLSQWRDLVQKIYRNKPKVKIGIIGKYQKTGDYTLSDAYVCVVEALRHASWFQNYDLEIAWFDAEALDQLTESEMGTQLKNLDGIVVPQGWGKRGVEGKIRAIKYARENKVPFLGLCFGMQMAVIEFARHICHLKRANSAEVNLRTPYPVIHVMANQKEYLAKNQFGGTIRLGQWPCQLTAGSQLASAYHRHGVKGDLVRERHRHRYEFNNRYRRSFDTKGMIISGTSPDGKLVEAIELPKEVHPFFVGTQFHPEYQSTPLNPHPLFIEFIAHTIRRD